MDAFSLSLAMIFLAELGDKTQLVALTLASRYKAAVVLAGIFAATLVVHIVSVLLGGSLGEVMPGNWIALGAGVAFIGFGLWTLRGDSLEEGEGVRRGRSPFWIVYHHVLPGRTGGQDDAQHGDPGHQPRHDSCVARFQSWHGRIRRPGDCRR